MKIISLNLFIASFVASSTYSQETTQSDFDIDANYQSGWREANLGLGFLFPNTVRRSDRPDSKYVIESTQAGYMLGSPTGDGIFRGNFELAPELFGAEIYGGPGNYIAGAALLLRYNFVPRDRRLNPFISIGFGGTGSDIPHKYDGKSFDFDVEIELGLRYFIKPKCSLNAEYEFQHISNANLWSNNVGLNTSGPVFGVSFFF